MSKAMYYQRGETLDYKNDTETTIEAGEILLIGKRIGVASTRIEPREMGAVDVVGVFGMPKAAGEIAMGETVYWNAKDGNIATADTDNVLAGYAAAAAKAEEMEVLVKINA